MTETIGKTTFSEGLRKRIAKTRQALSTAPDFQSQLRVGSKSGDALEAKVPTKMLAFPKLETRCLTMTYRIDLHFVNN